MTASKSFLARAKSQVQAAVNLQKELASAGDKVMAAANKAKSHLMISHAQYEGDENEGQGMIVVRPQSDSEVADVQVYSAPEMAAVGAFMHDMQSAGFVCELHLDVADTQSIRHQELYIEFYKM